MKKVKGIKKYAKQFLSAVDLNEIPKGIEQMSLIATHIEQDKYFRNFMISPAFTEKEREDFISDIADKLKMSEKIKKYLVYLSGEGVMGQITDIIKHIVSLYLDMKKRAKAIVITPTQISKDDEERLKDSLKHIINKEIDLDFIIDPSLLGGVRIKVGSTMYDSSINGQLGLLRDRLLK